MTTSKGIGRGAPGVPRRHFLRAREPLTPEQQPPPGARAIALTKGWAAWVDADDYDALSAFNWSICPGEPHRGPHYAVRRINPEGRYAKSVCVRMHRVVMGDTLVDHKEHRDSIRVVDNRKSNLRPATADENARNTRKIKVGASQYKGVTQTGRQGQFWQARIRVNGANRELGCYPSPERAALAYDEAAIRYYGDFAWTNFPRETQA